jgi:hypothetical protein
MPGLHPVLDLGGTFVDHRHLHDAAAAASIRLVVRASSTPAATQPPIQTRLT